MAVPERAVRRFGQDYHEPLAVLAFLSAAVRRTRLGTSALIVPYRGAVYQAKAMATLDHLSGGRMTFAVGAGWSEDESRVLRVDFHRRGRLTWEYLRAFRALWADEHLEFHGDFIDVEGVTFAPRPIQDPCRCGERATARWRCAAPPSFARRGTRRGRPSRICVCRYPAIGT
ncbi:MAG: LLM class flavin-dependent oxidoreductase [Dehalococcoidia bacterium]|nr:LLM class flavin-dependent oxidoreductase [Dehalococcoidia bacterium]